MKYIRDTTLCVAGADKQLNKFNMVSGEWLATGYGHQRDIHGVWLVDDQVLTVGMDGFCKVCRQELLVDWP